MVYSSRPSLKITGAVHSPPFAAFTARFAPRVAAGRTANSRTGMPWLEKTHTRPLTSLTYTSPSSETLRKGVPTTGQFLRHTKDPLEFTQLRARSALNV